MRSGGRTRYLLRQGVLRRGIPMALATAVLIEAIQGGLTPDSLGSAGFQLRLLVAFVVFSLGGVLSAYTQWKMLEKRFGSEQLRARER
jgi:hypothetical protein